MCVCVCVYNLLTKSVLELTHIVGYIFSKGKQKVGKRKQSCNEIRFFKNFNLLLLLLLLFASAWMG